MTLATIIFVICGIILYHMFLTAEPDVQRFAKEMLIATIVGMLVTAMVTILCIGIIQLVIQ